MCTNTIATGLAALGLGLWSGLAHASDAEPVVPKGKGTIGSASSGSTELAGNEKFGEAAEAPAEESTDATELDVSAGGLFSTGNARSIAATANGNFRIRRKIHQGAAAVAGNYGRAAVDDDWQDTVGNIQGLARYDVFFHRRWSAFTLVTARHDPFQGLDLRFNVDPGFAFYALTDPKHRLWFEAGYDFQFDLRDDDAIIERDGDDNPVLDADGNTIGIAVKQQLNHAVRLYAGYANRLDERITLDTGLEYLQSVIRGSRFRLNYNIALSTQIKERFSLSATFTLRYENEPLPEVEKLDTVTSLNVVYRFL